MTVDEQATKLGRLREEIEAEFSVRYRPFDQTPEYIDLHKGIEEQRDIIADLEEQVKTYRLTIAELRNTIRKTELAQYEKAERMVGSMSSTTGAEGARKNSTVTETMAGGVFAHVKELEMTLEKERKQRREEQNRNAERIAELEAELTITKGEQFKLSHSKSSIVVLHPI